MRHAAALIALAAVALPVAAGSAADAQWTSCRVVDRASDGVGDPIEAVSVRRDEDGTVRTVMFQSEGDVFTVNLPRVTPGISAALVFARPAPNGARQAVFQHVTAAGERVRYEAWRRYEDERGARRMSLELRCPG